jgi:predicted nucleic acid-binding Zn ribbon protein
MTAERLVTCPECQTDALKRLIGTGSGIIFKGSGFYETDYKRKTGKSSAPPSSNKKNKNKNKKDVAATPTPKKTT